MVLLICFDFVVFLYYFVPFRSRKRQPRQLTSVLIRQRKTSMQRMARWKNCIMRLIACRRHSLRWRRSARSSRNLLTLFKQVKLNHSVSRLRWNYRCRKMNVNLLTRIKKTPSSKSSRLNLVKRSILRRMKWKSKSSS